MSSADVDAKRVIPSMGNNMSIELLPDQPDSIRSIDNPTSIPFDGDSLKPDQIPEPCGWNVILAPIKITEKTSGDIILVSETVDGKEATRFISKVLAIGPLAFTGDKFRPHPNAPEIPFCRVGDIISTGQYTGSQIPCRTEEEGRFYLRMVADDEIKSIISDLSIIDV